MRDAKRPFQLKVDRDFIPSLISLYKRGGRYQKAADAIDAAMNRANRGDPEFLAALRPTKWGEDRIPHCHKYDLNDYSRLITVQTDGFCIFVYCGDHTESERWLKQNPGYTPVVTEDYVVTRTFVSQNADPETRLSGKPARSLGMLFQNIDEKIYDRLVNGVTRKTCRDLETLTAASFESDIWGVVATIDDDDRRLAIYDVFALLRQDKIREATDRAKLFLGDVFRLDQVSVDDLPETIDSDLMGTIDPRNPIYSAAVKRFMESPTYRYKDWMLFLHPEQSAVMQQDFNGPAKLVGVSGSGKTCVVVRRAIRLAEKYPEERILILTLNRALAQLITRLVDDCCAPLSRDRIDVKPFFMLCRDLLIAREPKRRKFYDEVTWKSNEHIDEIWQEYYRCEVNNYDARVLQRVHDSLLSRGWNAEKYLREEFDWIRSALTPANREKYLTMERVGRNVALSDEFKKQILDGLEKWEEKMEQVGVIDGLGIAQALYSHKDGLGPMYRAVLVDECQDFGNIELEIIRSLVAPAENDLFICGDAAQAVTTKYQLLRDAGIDLPGARSKRLQLNYRNSRDILQAAHQVLYDNLADEMYDRKDFDFLQPELSAMSASFPAILEAPTLTAEIRHAVAWCKELVADKPQFKACIAICGYTLYEITKFGEAAGLPVLDGSTDLDSGTIFLSDLEQTKGFEFDGVVIVNCVRDILPDGSSPESEWWRDVTRLYVAMTRAKTDLILSWSREKSKFLSNTEEYFLEGGWTEVSSEGLAGSEIVPKHLEHHRQLVPNWREMTAEHFLYTEFARGLSSDLIARMRELVTGVGLRKGDVRVEWSNLGTLEVDLREKAKVRRRWGATSEEMRECFRRLPT